MFLYYLYYASVKLYIFQDKKLKKKKQRPGMTMTRILGSLNHTLVPSLTILQHCFSH